MKGEKHTRGSQVPVLVNISSVIRTFLFGGNEGCSLWKFLKFWNPVNIILSIFLVILVQKFATLSAKTSTN